MNLCDHTHTHISTRFPVQMEIGYVSCVRRKWRCVVHRRRLFSYRNLYTARSKYERKRASGKKEKKLRREIQFLSPCRLNLSVYIDVALRLLCTILFFSFVLRLIRFSLSFVCHAFMCILLHTRFHLKCLRRCSGYSLVRFISHHHNSRQKSVRERANWRAPTIISLLQFIHGVCFCVCYASLFSYFHFGKSPNWYSVVHFKFQWYIDDWETPLCHRVCLSLNTERIRVNFNKN